MQLDRPFGSPKLRPRKQRQAQVDGGGVQGIDRGVEVEPELVAQVEFFGSLNENLCEVAIDGAVAMQMPPRFCSLDYSGFGPVGNSAGMEAA